MGKAKLEEYRVEAKARWGSVVDDSYAKAAKYSKADWAEIQKEIAAFMKVIADRMDKGPRDAQVQDGVRRWHKLINDRYYACSLEVFRGLGTLYVEDARFTAHYEKMKAGLAVFMRDAMHVYVDEQEGKHSNKR